MRISYTDTTKPEEKPKSQVKLRHFLVVFASAFLITFLWLGGSEALKTPRFVKPYETFSLELPSDLPAEIKTKLEEDLSKIALEGKPRFSFSKEGEFELGFSAGSGILNYYVVPVAHLYAIVDDFNPAKQKMVFSSSLPTQVKHLLLEDYPQAKEVEDIDKVLDEAGKTVALVEVKTLKATNKLLKFEGKYFLDDNNGSLVYSLGIKSGNTFVSDLIRRNVVGLKEFAFDTSSISKVNQTGVTAITRALAKKIDASGDFAYPAKKISEFLKDADITHVSNEISSVPGCVPTDGLRFCAKPEYLKVLEESGVDVVELTGNHNNDYGASFNLSTIKSYEKMGLKYFGGGKDKEDAAKILYLENKGTKLAFIGYNYYDTILGTGALAGEDRAGANIYSDRKMEKDIQKARSEADVVIVDFQFQECYSYPSSDVIYPICYKPLASPDQKGLFRKAVDYGADIVVGTQAHQPQTFEAYKGKLIFYGLGNLFFDQINWIGTRHGLILTHYFSKGKLIQTKLTTTNYDGDMQTYVTKGAQRVQLLNLIKVARD
ncbi:CapA family protein [bacterium]|nr:CapA family protein [bacterium]